MNNIPEIRTFFALPCGETLSQNIDEKVVFLRECSGIKGTPSHEYHMTLKFLGETPINLLEETKENLYRTIGQIPSFTLKLSSTGTFPKGSHPRILWIGSYFAPLALRQIVLQLNLLFKAYGYPREERRFKPHITIARVKGDPSKVCLEKFMNLNCEGMFLKATDVIWYESKLSPVGPEYIERMQIPLNLEKGR